LKFQYDRTNVIVVVEMSLFELVLKLLRGTAPKLCQAFRSGLLCLRPLTRDLIPRRLENSHIRIHRLLANVQETEAGVLAVQRGDVDAARTFFAYLKVMNVTAMVIAY